ncbi:MAG: exonuclease SbcC, partial [Labilithrix sp.]|nr:exonuclease SbcC [Labilithrix sp.]
MVLVSREGDPAAAIAVAVTTAGVPWGDAPGDDPEAATALAGLIESRLRAKSIDAAVTPSWDGVRASLLATTEADASRLAEGLRDAFLAPATEADLAAARKKLTALGQRPLRDRALVRWARCVGAPHALPERAGKDYADVDVARLERWRAASLGLGRIAVAVTGPPAIAENVASTILGGPAWKASAAIPRAAAATEPAVDVFEAAPDVASVPILHATLDVGTSSAAVTTAEALGDPRGPLAARLSELDLPFRLREVTGAAHARGGCVGVVLEAVPSTQSAATGGDLAARVADAVALVHLEAAVFLAETGTARDGRVLSRRAGDSREAAERAAWWALVDQGGAPRSGGGSVTLAVPSRRGAKEAEAAPSRESLAAAVTRATAAWDKPVVEARSRVESGQGEAWVLVGSPCGTSGETDADAGLTALVAAAAADAAKVSGDVRVEPWVSADGAGLLVHGPALAGETPSAHARRLADIAARSFAAEPLTTSALAHARADLLR